MRESFILYAAWWDQIALLTDVQRGQLMTAIYAHAMGRDIPSMDDVTAMAFSFIKAQLDRDAVAYQEKCKTNRENGAKGGRPRKPQKPNANTENLGKANGLYENPKKHDNDYEYEYGLLSDEDEEKEDEYTGRARAMEYPPNLPDEQERRDGDIDNLARAAYRAAYGKEPTTEEIAWLSRIAIGYDMAPMLGEAIRRAAQYGAASVCKYVAAIVREWAAHGITTPAELEHYDFLRAVANGEFRQSGVDAEEAVRLIAAHRDAKLQGRRRGRPPDQEQGAV